MNLKDNEYFIGTHSVVDICNQFDTPLYVYDLSVIFERVRALKRDLGVYPKTEFLYAVKANFNPHLLKAIVELGLGVDAVSPEEVRLGLAAGVNVRDILFTGNNMTDKEMHEVADLGVLQNIGSISRLKKFGKAFGGQSVCVRFNPNVGAASHGSNITGGPDSKFGISFKEVDTVLSIADKYSLRIVGVHQHIGSGWLTLDEPLMALDVILNIAKQFPDLNFVDVGGGFGVPYMPEEQSLDTRTLGDKLEKRFTLFCDEYGRELTLRFEPGRYIVAEAGHVFTRVNTIKKTVSQRTIVGTDTGMHQLARVALYGSYHSIVNVSNPSGKKMAYDVVGNICECADFFAKNRMLSEVREGDILSIENAGAYGMAMASNYQFRPLPAELLLNGDDVQVIRKRQTFDQMYEFFAI